MISDKKDNTVLFLVIINNYDINNNKDNNIHNAELDMCVFVLV